MRRLCILLIRLYQITLSPMFNAFTGGHGSCRFRPTCSAYGIGAFRKHGTIKGFWLTLLRLLRCNPWGGSGWDPVPDTFRWKYWPKCDNEPVPGTEGNCDHGKEPKYSPRTRLRRM